MKGSAGYLLMAARGNAGRAPEANVRVRPRRVRPGPKSSGAVVAQGTTLPRHSRVISATRGVPPDRSIKIVRAITTVSPHQGA